MVQQGTYRYFLKPFAVATFVVGLSACNDDGQNSGPSAAKPEPELTVAAAPTPPPAAGAGDLTQVGPAESITARTQELTFTTLAITGPTKVRVTLPTGYDPNGSQRYPVVYLLHGGLGNQTYWTSGARNLEAVTPNVPVIFVTPDDAGVPAIGVGNYTDWYNGGRFGPPMDETYHMRQLVPWIDQHFLTIAKRNARATAGYSAGGHGAFHYAETFPDLIGVSASLSGAIDNTLPTNGLRGASAAFFVNNLFGPYETQELRWRAAGSVDAAKNLSNTNLFMSYGDAGNPEGTYIKPGAEAVQQRLNLFGIPFAFRFYPGAGHNTEIRALGDWLPIAVPLLTDPARQALPNPASFSYSSIKGNYQVFGWNVGITRTAAEFSTLEVADQNNFSVIGSGQATVQTAPLAASNTIYRVMLSGGSANSNSTIYVRTDVNGRAVIPVLLGPANPFQQYTADADAGSASVGPDAALVPFTVRGSGSRFYAVKVSLSPYAP